MNDIATLLKTTAHRPFPLPTNSWKYYQEWHETLFYHWSFPQEIIAELLPDELEIDTFDGKAWVSLVSSTVKNLRLKFLPTIDALSNFNEVNLRTYVIKDGKPGMYFFSLEADKLMSVMMNKTLFGLNYKKAEISRGTHECSLGNVNDKHFFYTKYLSLECLSNKSNLDKWLTERYCIYHKDENTLYKYNVHHEEWQLKNLKAKKVHLHFQKGNLILNNCKPDVKHYSPMLKVISWGKEKC
ncbi:MAG TPA: DUF2071 domain-containing protein [Flavobacterium sp.]|jgi:hypothetical protein|nr:DUF2071 domain-containing protein [Flavobacterium sp.]